jgi:hypothetical protein
MGTVFGDGAARPTIGEKGNRFGNEIYESGNGCAKFGTIA